MKDFLFYLDGAELVAKHLKVALPVSLAHSKGRVLVEIGSDQYKDPLVSYS
jgi:hypothetical protein